jgi:hypothetical protein
LTIEVNVTSGNRAATLFKERADVLLGIACGRMSGWVRGGPFLDVPELPFKLAIPTEQRKEVDRGNRRIPSGL